MFSQKLKSEETLNNTKIDLLIDELSELFSISNDNDKKVFEFHPFSNENHCFQNIVRLNDIPPVETDKIKIAIVFGEGYFLSSLPELSRHADVVILADIEPRMHLHTKHLLTCFKNSPNRGSFKQAYESNNPVSAPYPPEIDPLMPLMLQIGLFQPRRFGEEDKEWNLAQLCYEMICAQRESVLGNYHFLASNERYMQCKATLNKISFVNINFNLADSSECQSLCELLEKFNATLSICNFTNIHHYHDESILRTSIGSLLKNSPHCFIMHSDTLLSAQFSVSEEEYFCEAYKKRSVGVSKSSDS